MQRHIQRGLRRLAEQQVALAQVEQAIALGQGELQLQRDAAVGDVDLQGMAQRTHQFAAADRVGEVVLLVVLAMKQHQAAAIVERVQLGLVKRRGLLQAVSIALQQFGQARPRQAAQLFLPAELDGQHGAASRLRRGRRLYARGTQ